MASLSIAAGVQEYVQEPISVLEPNIDFFIFLIAMASTLLALVAMASNLRAMASNFFIWGNCTHHT